MITTHTYTHINIVWQFMPVHIFWSSKHWQWHLYRVTGVLSKKAEQMKTQCGDLQCSRAHNRPSSPRHRKAVLGACCYRRCRWSNPRGRLDPWRYILSLPQPRSPHSEHSGLQDKGLLVTEELLDHPKEAKVTEAAGSSYSSLRHSTNGITTLNSDPTTVSTAIATLAGFMDG